MNLLNIKIITPAGVEYEGKVERATIPTADGQITVLANHTPLVSLLSEGEIILKGGDTDEVKYKTKAGFLEVRHDSEAILLPDYIEKSN
ncbi:MAG: hypothetical protein R3251_00020 [Candidatus Spechtbacterales bacterium]|nr:hypothetical protein [Candidatus Spechtbacterales bacterium]